MSTLNSYRNITETFWEDFERPKKKYSLKEFLDQLKRYNLKIVDQQNFAEKNYIKIGSISHSNFVTFLMKEGFVVLPTLFQEDYNGFYIKIYKSEAYNVLRNVGDIDIYFFDLDMEEVSYIDILDALHIFNKAWSA
jgi:hypothetical protein